MTIKKSLIADGCHISEGAVIENSIIGPRCLIGRGVTIRDSIIMGADEYERSTELEKNKLITRPRIGIGDGALIEGSILDKNCRVGRNVRIVNERGLDNSIDADDCIIRDGIPIVVKEATIPDGWRLV